MAVKDAVLHALEEARGTRLSGGRLAEQLGVSRAAVHKAIGVLRSEGLSIDGITGEGYHRMMTASPLRVCRRCWIPKRSAANCWCFPPFPLQIL